MFGFGTSKYPLEASYIYNRHDSVKTIHPNYHEDLLVLLSQYYDSMRRCWL